MKDKILNSCINFLQRYNNYSKKDLLKLRYGLEGIYLTITKLIVILFLALVLGIFKEAVLVIIFFNILRFFGFGFHADKSSQCLIMSIINFVLIPFLLLKTHDFLVINIIISVFCIINFILFAPADTVKRPLYSKRKRIIKKSLTILTGIIYLVFIIIFNNHIINSILISSLIIQTIMSRIIAFRDKKIKVGTTKND